MNKPQGEHKIHNTATTGKWRSDSMPKTVYNLL